MANNGNTNGPQAGGGTAGQNPANGGGQAGQPSSGSAVKDPGWFGKLRLYRRLDAAIRSQAGEQPRSIEFGIRIGEDDSVRLRPPNSDVWGDPDALLDEIIDVKRTVLGQQLRDAEDQAATLRTMLAALEGH